MKYLIVACYLLVLCVLVLAGVCIGAAQEIPQPARFKRLTHVLPPAEYDRPYTGNLTLIRVDGVPDILRHCRPTPMIPIGCSYRRVGECTVYMASDAVIRRAGYSPEIVRRHELGHCNGWPSNHPGARRE